ncbi:MAG: hypothetical protein IKO84_10285 [Butyrivibrio sp.]|nr:hypothetical protein [Butyrivibrio sp.]
MDYKVDINKDKWFDVRKTTEVFEALKQEAETYCKNSDATGLAYQSFVASEAFMGQSADDTKNFVGNGMGKMNSDIKETVLKCLKNQEDVLTAFSEMVDSSPNAYIDYNTLKVIDQDFDGYYTNFKSIAQSVDVIINKLNNEFGKDLGEFPKPDKGGVQNAFNDMCGAESGGGYIKECQDKFISFDSTMSDHVRANDTVAFRDDITGKLTNATNAFFAGEAMPMPARFNDVKIQTLLDPNKATEAANITRNSPYNGNGRYGANHDDVGESHWGIFGLNFDGDGDVDKYLKPRRDWDRIYNAYDNRGANDNTLGDAFADKRSMAIFKMLEGTTSADAAATNVIFDQLKTFNDDLFLATTGVDRFKDGQLNYRVLQAALRECSFDRTSLYDQGALEKLIMDKCSYYKNHMDEFKKKYPGQRLQDRDGSYSSGALTLIRMEIMNGINNNELVNSLVGENSINKPNSGNPNTVYSDVKNSETSVLSTINELSLFSTRNNLKMSTKCLNDFPRPVSSESILKELVAGNSVIAEFEDFVLKPVDKGSVLDEDVKIDGKKQVTITGVYGNSYIVAYNGMCGLLTPNAVKMGDCYSIKIVPGWENREALQYGTNPFYGNRDKSYVDPDGVYRNKEYDKLADFISNNPEYKGWLSPRALNVPYNNKLADAIDDMANRGARDFDRIDMLAEKYLDNPQAFKEKYNIDLIDQQSGKVNKDFIALDYYKDYGNTILVDCNKSKDIDYLTNFYYSFYLGHMDLYRLVFHKMDKTNISHEDIRKNCKELVEKHVKATKDEGKTSFKLKLEREYKKFYEETSFSKNEEMENAKFKQYCKEHGDNVTFKMIDGKTTAERMQTVKKGDFNAAREAVVFDGIPTNNDIRNAQKSGYNVFFHCDDISKLEDERGLQVMTLGLGELRAKELKIKDVVTEKDPNGNIIRERYRVICNGNEYYYDPTKHTEDCNNYSAIKIS